MKRLLITTASLSLLGLSLSACGGGGGSSATVTPPPAAKFEAQFGANFATAFGAAANTEPKDVAAGDTIGVSLTAEPVPLPGT
jgi:hypothetical protein